MAQGCVKRLPLGSQRAPRLEPEIAKNVLRTPCGTGARKRCGRGQSRKSPLKVLPTRRHLFDWARGSQRPPNLSLKTVGCTHKGSNRQQERRSTKPLAPQLLFNARRRLKFLSTFYYASEIYIAHPFGAHLVTFRKRCPKTTAEIEHGRLMH